jgi:hypothetical protein
MKEINLAAFAKLHCIESYELLCFSKFMSHHFGVIDYNKLERCCIESATSFDKLYDLFSRIGRSDYDITVSFDGFIRFICECSNVGMSTDVICYNMHSSGLIKRKRNEFLKTI